jgi:hypothetical protein
MYDLTDPRQAYLSMIQAKADALGYDHEPVDAAMADWDEAHGYIPPAPAPIVIPVDRYTLAGLRAERAALLNAIHFAGIGQRPWADTLWAALRTLDAECVAAGLATCFDASGLAVR